MAYLFSFLSAKELERLELSRISELAAGCWMQVAAGVAIASDLNLLLNLPGMLVQDWQPQLLRVHSGRRQAKQRAEGSLSYHHLLSHVVSHSCGSLFVDSSLHIGKRRCQLQQRVLMGNGGRRGEVGLGMQCMLDVLIPSAGLTTLRWCLWSHAWQSN